MGLFNRAKPIVSSEQLDWLIEHYDWLEDRVQFPDEGVPLVRPTEDYFTRPPTEGHERAEHIFNEVRDLMGMSEWRCRLSAQAEDANPVVGDLLIVQNVPNSPLGTFRVEPKSNDNVVVTYNPSEISNPYSLIATFAHELSHYLLHNCFSDRPRRDTDEECLTDLLAIASGFGLFLADSRFQFSQFQGVTNQGWQTKGAGYLSEREIITALALFLSRNDIEATEAKPYLKPHLWKLLKRAMAALG